MLLCASMMCGNYDNLRDDVVSLDKAGVDMFHIDIMDGNFVPNISFGPVVIKSIREKSKMIFDVHLMIDEPSRYIKDFADAGAARGSAAHVPQGP